MVAFQKAYPDARIWQNNTGSAYAIPSVKSLIAAAFTLNPQKIQEAVKKLHMIFYGFKGSADITGIMGDGRRVEIEIKTGKARQSEVQKKFQKMITERGGIYLLITNQKPISEQLSCYERRENEVCNL